MGKLGSGTWSPRWPGIEAAREKRLELELLAEIAGELHALSSYQPGFDPAKHSGAVSAHAEALLAGLWSSLEAEAIKGV